MGSHRTRLLYVALLAVLAGVVRHAVATVPPDQEALAWDGTTTYSTDFEDPLEVPVDGRCEWMVFVDDVMANQPAPPLDRAMKRSGPWWNLYRSNGWWARSAHSFGQVFQSTWAFDSMGMDDATGTHDHLTENWASIYRIDGARECVGHQEATLKPTFKLYGGVAAQAWHPLGNGPEVVNQRAQVTITIADLDNLQADLDISLDVSDSGSSGTIRVLGQIIPVPTTTSVVRKAARQHPAQWKRKDLDHVHITFQQTTTVPGLSADGFGWNGGGGFPGAVEGYVYDSFAGTKILSSCSPRGESGAVCSGSLTTSFTWFE